MNAEWVEQLKQQFGDAVTADAGAFAVQGVVPACVCAPADEAQAAAVIRFAAAQRISVVPCGGGTEQGKGLPPPPEFLALSTRRFNKLIHHEPGDMVATAQGGMSVGAFQDAIRAGGQWLPLDAPSNATIGGLVAANTHGPRAFGYGTLRDMILGMNVINGDGVMRKCGGKVVKNVTGYSLDKLYIGSLGTLGLVTEVTFKLRPLSVDGRAWFEQFSSQTECFAAMAAIAAKHLPVETLCVDRSFGAEAAIVGLTVTAAGTRLELERIESEIRSAVPGYEFSGIGYASIQKHDAGAVGQQNRIWGDFESSILQYARERTASGAMLRFGCMPSRLNAAFEVLSPHKLAPYSVGISGGTVDLAPLTEPEAARIASEFEKLDINFAFENVVGVNIPNRWGNPRPEWAIMKQLKAALDPAGIMNPGRFVV